MKSKDLHPKILYTARLAFKIEGQLKSFPDKKKLKEYITRIIRNVKETSLKRKVQKYK